MAEEAVLQEDNSLPLGEDGNPAGQDSESLGSDSSDDEANDEAARYQGVRTGLPSARILPRGLLSGHHEAMAEACCSCAESRAFSCSFLIKHRSRHSLTACASHTNVWTLRQMLHQECAPHWLYTPHRFGLNFICQQRPGHS